MKRFSTSITKKKILENKLSYPNPKGGHVMRFQVFLSLWSVTRRQCIDKILKGAKTKVSNPKRYSLLKLKLTSTPNSNGLFKHAPPPMSTSRCGKICITPPKCLCKERGSNFYSRIVVAAASAMYWRYCVSL